MMPWRLIPTDPLPDVYPRCHTQPIEIPTHSTLFTSADLRLDHMEMQEFEDCQFGVRV